MRVIEYKGKTLKTKYNKIEIPDKLYFELIKEHNKKLDFTKQLYDLLYHKHTQINKIIDYFFKDIMFDTVLWHSKWSINDVFSYKPLLSVFYNKVIEKPNVFTGKDLYAKIMTAIRLGGKGIASKPTNFSFKYAIDLLQTYNKGPNYLDTSCGWGVRLLSALYLDLNYFGIDPNYKLFDRLLSLYFSAKQLKSNIPDIDLRLQGSEFLIKSWINKMDIAFTSYPYFQLEDYKYGQQSIKVYPTYRQWKTKFLFPTIKNTYLYLKHNRYLLANIKDYKSYTLEQDLLTYAEFVGFKHIDTLIYSNTNRVSLKKGKKYYIDNSEKIYVLLKE